jgi:hypothetical protein
MLWNHLKTYITVNNSTKTINVLVGVYVFVILAFITDNRAERSSYTQPICAYLYNNPQKRIRQNLHLPHCKQCYCNYYYLYYYDYCYKQLMK